MNEALALKKRGIRVVRWQMRIAQLRLFGGFFGSAIPIGYFVYAFASFVLPGAPIIAWVLVGVSTIVIMIGGIKPAWRDIEAWAVRRQELKILSSIHPLLTRYRNGGTIDNQDRQLIFQLREPIVSQAAKYREEATEWRRRGWQMRAAGLDALIFDLEDAQKMLTITAAVAEQAIRPAPPAPRVEMAPPPVAKPLQPQSALARYRKSLVKRTESS